MNEEVKENIENTEENSEINSIYQKILHKEDKANLIASDKDSSITLDKEIKKPLSKDNKVKEEKSEDAELKKEIKSSKEGNSEKEQGIDDSKYKVLEKQVHDAKKWGQQKNRELINSKRKVSEFANKLIADGLLQEEEVQDLINSFSNIDIDNEEDKEEKIDNPYIELKQKIDNEFKTFKRYNKGINLEEKYDAFYAFFPMMSASEQEESLNYLKDAEPDIALDYVITNGSELYDNLFKGAKEKGGVLKYVKFLQSKIEKLEKKSKELETELDTSTKKIYNKTQDSSDNPITQINSAKEFLLKRYGG